MGKGASINCVFVCLHLHECCYSYVGTASLFGQVLVFPEDVFGHRLHQGLHAAQVGRREALGPRQLQEQDSKCNLLTDTKARSQ